MRVVSPMVMAAAVMAAAGLPGWAAEEKPAADLDQAIVAAASYESGQSLEPFRQLEQAVRESLDKPEARREVEAGLIRLLEPSSTLEARKFACKQLGIIGTEAALPALATLLEDPETSGIACLALTTYPPGKADQVLRDGLISSNDTVRVQLLTTLGDRRDAKSIPLLGKLASAQDKAVSEAAIAALGKIGTPAALRILRQVREKTSGELSPALADALLRCAQNLSASGSVKRSRALCEDLLEKAANDGVRRSALSLLLASDSDGGRRRILEVLSSKDDALKPVAIAAIASIEDPSASEEFAIQMHHLRPDLQVLMLETLAARGDDAARLQLAKALSLPEPMVRRAAIVCLGRMADPYFVSLLTRAAATASDAQESRAIEAALVGMKGGADTDRQLIAQLKLAPTKAQVVLIATLVQRQGAAACKVFLEQADNSDPVVAKAAFRALAKVGSPKEAEAVIGKLVTIEDAGVRDEAESTAAKLLAQMPAPGDRTALVHQALGRATTVRSRKALLALLPTCGDDAALAELKIALGDDDPDIREAAVRALAEWPNDLAWNELVLVYRNNKQEALRAVALRGLVRLLEEQNAQPDAAVLGRYKQLFSSARSETDLKLLLSAVAGVSHPDAVPLVLPLLANKDVHAEAVLALRKIAESIKAEHPQATEDVLKQLQATP